MHSLLPLLILLGTGLLCFTFTEQVHAEDEVVAHLNSGAVKGAEVVDENGNKFYSFRGIPYAEAPVGNLRFRPPVQKSPWNGVLDGTKDGPFCPQLDLQNKTVIGDENCLMINVYTPKMPKAGDDVKLDVIVNIPGGGFVCAQGGADYIYGPQRFMQKEKNIILVSFNYRLSILGFMDTDDPASPGNYGLLDQVEALRWVRNNIERFGGDPNKVTIFGASAGGASVIFHYLSPLSKGYFQRAISRSGTALAYWATQYVPRYWTKSFASRLNCPVDDMSKLVSCLREKSMEELINNTRIVQDVGAVPMVHMPSVDHYFLMDTASNVAEKKVYTNVPLMIGITRDEGDQWFRMLPMNRNGSDFTDNEIYGLIKTLLGPVPDKDKIAKMLQPKYFSDVTSRNTTMVYKILGQIATDGMFRECHYKTVKLLTAKGVPTYVYSYDYEGEIGDINKMLNTTDKLGVGHGQDMVMLFTGIYSGGIKTGDSLLVQKNVQKSIINFALYGTPNHGNPETDWPRSEPNHINVYHIDINSTLSIYDETKDDKYDFWINDIPKAINESLAEFYDENECIATSSN